MRILNGDTHQQCRCDEGEAGVLHTAIREARWQHQQVVHAPHVRTKQGLCRLDEVLGLMGEGRNRI